MKRPLAIGGLVAVAVAGVTWAGLSLRPGDRSRPADPRIVSAAVPENVLAGAPTPAADEVQIDAQDVPVDAGTTPMGQRVAVLGLLNKRNGISRDLALKPGQAGRIGDVIVRLRACEKTAPWEPEQLTGAFVQLDVRGGDGHWRRAFSGWLYKERPALNVVLHPVYDVWPKSCTTAFPAAAPSAPAISSGTRKSAAVAPRAAAADEPVADEAIEKSAVSSNAL